MNLKGILSISGHRGLFKHISQTRVGIIVENLEDHKRMPAFATSKISALEDIAIYTEDGDIPLVDLFVKMREKENGGQALSSIKPTPEQYKSYFAEVLPNYDKERVYISDIKRAVLWYNILQSLDMLKDEPETETEAVVEEPSAE